MKKLDRGLLIATFVGVVFMGGVKAIESAQTVEFFPEPTLEEQLTTNCKGTTRANTVYNIYEVQGNLVRVDDHPASPQWLYKSSFAVIECDGNALFLSRRGES